MNSHIKARFNEHFHEAIVDHSADRLQLKVSALSLKILSLFAILSNEKSTTPRNIVILDSCSWAVLVAAVKQCNKAT